MKKNYSPKFNFSKKTPKKDNDLDLKIDFVGVIDKDKNLGQSVLYGKIDFPKNRKFKKGWYAVDAKQVVKKVITQDAKLLYLGNAPLNGIKVFLAGWHFRGIGEVLADKIVNDANMNTLRAIKGSTSQIRERFDLKEEQAKTINLGWAKNKDVAHYDILLNELGFTNVQKRRLKEDFGISIIQTLITNPISLLGIIPYLSLEEIEKICERLEFKISDELIVIATTNHVLKKKETSDGHTCYPLERVLNDVVKLKEFEKDFILNIIKNPDSNFRFSQKNDKEIIESETSQLRDKKIIQEINRIISKFERGKNKKSFTKSELKSQKNVNLSDEQIEAVNTAVNSPISIITGGPGAGKTTMVKALVSAITNLKLNLKLTAPTGKAATRISTEGLKKYKPTTIHSYLGVSEGKSEENFDIMIVDESSMIDIDLMNSLLVSIPDKASIVFIGDADQLPPVGPGQVFKDLIKSNKIKVSKLTGNYRQDSMSGIAKAAREIVRGKIPNLNSDFKNDIVFSNIPRGEQAQKVLELYFEAFPTSGIKQDDIQILTPQREGEVGLYNLNRLIQQKITAQGSPVFSNKVKSKNGDFEMNFYSGDKVIMRKNKVKELGLVNGDIGRVLRKNGNLIITEFNEKEVEFSTKDAFDLQLAYAITIHLSQGSDYKGVIITCSSEHRFMLKRNLIYTALTRAKDKAVLVGEENSLNEGIQRIPDLRYTNLVEMLQTEIKDE